MQPVPEPKYKLFENAWDFVNGRSGTIVSICYKPDQGEWEYRINPVAPDTPSNPKYNLLDTVTDGIYGKTGCIIGVWYRQDKKQWVYRLDSGCQWLQEHHLARGIES